HPNRDSPTSKPGFFSNRRSTRAGCEGALARLPFAPRAVLLHPNRVRTEGGAPTSQSGFAYIKTGVLLEPQERLPRVRRCSGLTPFSHRGRCSYSQIGVLLHRNRGSLSNRRSTRPGCEGFWTGAPGVSRRAVLRPDNRIH